MQPLPARAFQAPWPSSWFPQVSRHERAGPLWLHPHRGVTQSALLDRAAAGTRILAASAALSGVPLATWAAAYVHGATALDGLADDGRTELPVVFCPGRSGARGRRPGLEPLRSLLADDDVTTVHGLPVTSPLRTAFDLGRTAPDLDTAVADVDAVLRATRTPVAELSAYAQERPGWKGVPLLRAALPLLDPRARSRPESRMRVVWVRDAGLPRPQVNVETRSQQDGVLLGIPDLLDLETGLVGEYDGAGHRETRQHGADNVREETFEEHGLTVVRAIWDDVRRRQGLARRLRSGHARARRQQRRTWYVPPSQLRQPLR
ncbi:MAG: hypothetical protein ACLGIV_01205 [Actinomycetes bacterium]